MPIGDVDQSASILQLAPMLPFYLIGPQGKSAHPVPPGVSASTCCQEDQGLQAMSSLLRSRATHPCDRAP